MTRREARMKPFLGCSVAGLAAMALAAAAADAPPSAARPFRLEALTDFVDDALATVVTPGRVDAMMARLAEMGVTRVSWAYYGDGHGGFLVPYGLSGEWRNLLDTWTALGNPLQVAVESAHRHGIELYAYYKPYETGPAVSLPEGSADGLAYGRIRQQGGWLTWMDLFVVEHPELRIRRRDDSANTPGGPICALRLTKRDGSPTRVTAEHLQIWTSDLNHRYERLQVPFEVVEAVEPSPKEVREVYGEVVTRKGDPVRTLTLSGFRLTAPYVLVTTDFTEGPSDFENTGTDLLAALDEHGREIPGVFANGGGIWEPQRVDFRRWGLLFDTGFGRALTKLDEPNASGQKGLIAFARGRNEYLPGALCETEPEVQAFWLRCIDEMLAAGVDGIDFRVENHGTHTDFPEEYGFNEAVLRECSRRGLRPDAANVSRVRGAAYTEFMRRAKERISLAGKRMRANLNVDWFRPDPPPARRLAYSANIDYDWRTWVREGLLDEGIMRVFLLPFDRVFSDPVTDEMTAECAKRGIPLVVNRYVNDNCPAEYSRVRADVRFEGFILYETATYLHFDADAQCQLVFAPVGEVCRLMREGAGQ